MMLLGAGLCIIVLSGILARALERRTRAADRAFRWGMLAGCAPGLWAAVSLLVSQSPAPASAGAGAAFGLDPLSAWFLIIVLGVGTTTAIYGIHYLARERPGRRIGTAHLLLAVLITAMAGVVTAQTILAFMGAWEIMAITAYFLVVFEHEHAEVRRAGLLYLVLSHVCIIALVGMFAAWGGGVAGGSFQELAASAVHQRAPVALVLVLALIGFGIKAGVVPGHFWLPSAHASAPSHVSAVLSGVMIKTGIYGLLRVLTLVGPPPAWWAWSVLLLGLASAVLGVLWALAQHDLKRLLAYHSVENIGIILMGLGLGALGSVYHHPALALLGFTGALLHTLNHALFKSLLFLGAGAVLRVTGTREIDRLGGLVRVMPRTAWAFLIAAVAIVGLPPLNGFVSEWLIFRGLLGAGGTAGALRSASAAAAGLALTGALALACFTKVYGALFLGSPREAMVRESAAERGLVAPQLVLAAACITIGVLPILVIPAAMRAAAVVLQGRGAIDDVVAATQAASRISLAALGLVGLTAIIWLVRAGRMVRGGAPVAATWGGAFPTVTSRMQYTASSYAASLLALFGPLSGTHRIVGPTSFQVHTTDPILDRVGRPLWGWLRRSAQGLRGIQTGRIMWYLIYVISALLGLLLYLWLVAAQ
jgi:hydrogenase-4 component B